MQNATENLVKLGRYMITTAPRFADDVQFNRWARVGQLLTELGMPFAPRLREFGNEDQLTVREAAAVMTGRVPMPAMMAEAPAAEPRRTRKARMTKVMTKPAKATAAKSAARKSKPAKEAKAGEPKRRGRPPGSKNKPKTVTAKTATKKRK